MLGVGSLLWVIGIWWLAGCCWSSVLGCGCLVFPLVLVGVCVCVCALLWLHVGWLFVVEDVAVVVCCCGLLVDVCDGRGLLAVGVCWGFLSVSDGCCCCVLCVVVVCVMVRLVFVCVMGLCACVSIRWR